jgi:putative transposase
MRVAAFCKEPKKRGLPGRRSDDKRVWRLYRANNLAVRKRRKAKRIRNERMPLLQAREVNRVWSLDFVMDSLANGRRIKS